MNVVVLDYQENFLDFLDPELLDISEEYEIGGIRTIDVAYYMQDIDDAKKLFKIGNKIWVQGDQNLTDCLYVINTEVTRDYFQKNNVQFTAEDVIVELNYVDFFKQTDLVAKNGFTITSTAGEINVTVNHKALDFWFGEYFQIGIVQDCLNTEISKIYPTGTMTKMELLRYIEKETNNVFIPRYEKDLNNNVIHRFLDFLNPNSSDNNWSVTFSWTPTDTTELTEDSPIGTYDDVLDEDDMVTFPPYTPPVEHDPSNITVSIKDKEGNVIEGLNWNAETDLGVDGDSDVVDITIKYSKPNLTASVNNKTYNASSSTITDRTIDTSEVEEIVVPAGLPERDETLLTSVSEDTTLDEIILPNHTVFEVYDTETETILYRHELNPLCGDVHEDILDLAYNVENIEYTLNEEDTFTAISPKFTFDESNDITLNDMASIINNWVNLSVKKGDKIPMIVERMSLSVTPTTSFLNQSTVSSNYYARPLKPNDDAPNNKYEYFKAIAYWYAPFTKVAGEMYVEDREVTGVDYSRINTRPDNNNNPYGVMSTPKTGIVETSDENKYAVYNDVAMKLKDKRFPEIEIQVDVANYKDGKYNNYGIYDKVFVKVPGFEGLITAIVSKTSKKAHDIGKNTIELSNFNVGTKVATHETMLVGDNISLKYPKKGNLNVTLNNISSSDTALANKLVNFALYQITDNNTVFKKNYTKITNSSGIATLPINLNPGEYYIDCSFGGDLEYSPCQATYDVVISGTVTTSKTTTSSKSTKTTKKTRYYDKYGRSPDGKYILGIGRPSASGELSKYGYKFWEQEFIRKCPHCGSKKIYWSIFWAGNEHSDYGIFPATKKREGSSAEGAFFCADCDADWSVFGKDHGKKGKTKNLTSHGKAKKSSKTKAYELKKGKRKYDSVTVKISSKKNSKKTTTHTPVGTVNKKVKEWALKKVGSSTGAAAAKKLAKAVGALHYVGYKNFSRKPSTVISKGGNCCDLTRLFLMSCDAVGVSETYTLKYVYVCCNKSSWPGVGHIFARLTHKTTGNSIYVDCTHSPYWNTYLRGWGTPPGRQKNYPNTPF